MKSLRLHKYTDRLLGLTSEDLLTLTDRDLQKLVFTEGAKGKFLKQLQAMRERPRKIREMQQSLEVSHHAVRSTLPLHQSKAAISTRPPRSRAFIATHEWHSFRSSLFPGMGSICGADIWGPPPR